jgi:hypothetical protein
MKNDEFKERVFEIVELFSSGSHEEAIDELYKDIFQIRKICSKCAQVFPADKKYFANHPRTRDGFQSQWRSCQDEANKTSGAKKAEQERIETGHQWKDYEEDFTEPVEDFSDYEEDFVDFKEPSHA